MRLANIIVPAAVFIAVVGAFSAGHYIGKFDAWKASEAAVHDLDAYRSAEAFLMATAARQALREAKPARAELVLVRYAALKAHSLVECSSSPRCAASVGKILPTKEQMAEVFAAERAMKAPQ